jgi:hypothetical protein
MSSQYRILSKDYRILYTGGNSWMTLERARQLVKPSLGEMIYQYDDKGRALWEVIP